MMKEDCGLHLTPCPDTIFYFCHFDGVSSVPQLYSTLTTVPGSFNVKERQCNNKILHHIHVIHHISAAKVKGAQS